MSKLAQQLSGQSQAKCYAKGGMVHNDAKQDKALIKKTMKEECGCNKKCGGMVKKGKK